MTYQQAEAKCQQAYEKCIDTADRCIDKLDKIEQEVNKSLLQIIIQSVKADMKGE